MRAPNISLFPRVWSHHTGPPITHCFQNNEMFGALIHFIVSKGYRSPEGSKPLFSRVLGGRV